MSSFCCTLICCTGACKLTGKGSQCIATVCKGCSLPLGQFISPGPLKEEISKMFATHCLKTEH